MVDHETFQHYIIHVKTQTILRLICILNHNISLHYNIFYCINITSEFLLEDLLDSILPQKMLANYKVLNLILYNDYNDMVYSKFHLSYMV